MEEEYDFEDNDEEEEEEAPEVTAAAAQEDKPDIENKVTSRGVIFEENQRQNDEEEAGSDHEEEESVINICHGKGSEVVVEKLMNRQLSSGITPVPAAQVPVPMTQEEMQIDSRIEGGQPETVIVPFLSDE